MATHGNSHECAVFSGTHEALMLPESESLKRRGKSLVAFLISRRPVVGLDLSAFGTTEYPCEHD